MARKRLLWQLYPSYLAVTLLALLAVGWYVATTLRAFHVEQTAIDLRARAVLVRNQLEGRMQPERGDEVNALCRQLGETSGTRITVVLPDGTVLGDSVEEPSRMDNHADRPEIVAALQRGEGVSTRFSHTLGQTMMYVALSAGGQERVVGTVRTSVAITAIDRTLNAIFWRIAAGGLGVALLAAGISFFVSRRIARPLEEMKRGAVRFARGELGRRLPVSHSEEIGGLAEALNQMAAQLDDRIGTVVRQRNEQEAVLSSMVEGVLAVDAEERIIRANRAAGRLFNIDPRVAKGRPIHEMIRKTDLQEFVSKTLQSSDPVEEQMDLRVGGEEKSLQAHGTPLYDSTGRHIGALVVLNDVTRLRRLENVRREFVANVSHELKTPITAIKGSAETLSGGALDDPRGAERFVGIIARQADRLNAIIDDLLDLSRIEQGGGDLEVTMGAVKPVLEAAIQASQVGARDKEVAVTLFCSDDLRLRMNAPLLEQAVVNLLTNAIKYSERHGKVVVDAALLDDQVMIKVQDWGCGIPAEALPRLFERFYRVDKARSRNLGGTGLGLAIVKHIVQAHGGEVIVHSTSGQGSVFIIALPVA